MAFTDFLDLRTAVLEHVGRADIADVFPRLVKLAEARFNRELRMTDQITSATVTFTSGTAPLPSDFAEAIGLYNASGYEYVQTPPQSVKPSNTASYYSVVGSNLEANGVSEDRTLQYYAQIPTITDSMTDTNWLLAKYPGLYLYGVAYEAAKYIRDVELVQVTKALFDAEMIEARTDDQRSRFSRARVRVQGATP